VWHTVELRELRAFLTLADELHFGRTAQRLNVTPARISQTIRQLEARVGAKLFDRTSRRVSLTPSGILLRDRIRRPYDELEAGFNDTRTAATGLTGTLRLGMYTPINGGPHLGEIMRTYEQRHPGCSASVIDTGLERGQLDWLRSGDVDLLVMRLPVYAADVVIGPVLSSERRILVLARDHPLASRTSIGPEDLAGYTMAVGVAIPRETAEALMPAATPSGQPIAKATVRSFAEAIMRVARGELLHMTVRSFVDHYGHPQITYVPTDDETLSETALIWLATNRDPRVRAFTDTATSVLAQWP
jgi:DNA-binding transcriptional LysR family regulator